MILGGTSFGKCDFPFVVNSPVLLVITTSSLLLSRTAMLVDSSICLFYVVPFVISLIIFSVFV